MASERIRWAFCWVCYWLAIYWPRLHIPLAILPYAGEYAYTEDFATYRTWRKEKRA